MTAIELREGIKTVEKRLQGKHSVFTVADVVAITGYSYEVSKEVLDTLVEKYTSRLQVTEDGDLIYDFGKNLQVRGERTWAEFWDIVRKRAWQIFVFIFKIWISLTLLVYFTLFLVIMIAIIILLVASSGDDDSDSSSSIDFNFLGAISEIFASVFQWNTHTHATYYALDFYGYSYQTYREPTTRVSRLRKKNKKSFVASVYDFVFGPPRVDVHPLTNIRELTSYLRENKGIVTVSELIGLAGWTAKEAEEFLTESIIYLKGEARISENGVLYGDFRAITASTNTKRDAPIIWYWDEYEPPYKLTGNTTGRNATIAFLNGFNLVFASFFALFPYVFPQVINDFGDWFVDALGEKGYGNYALSESFSAYIIHSPTLHIGLGWVPFVFSLLFFLVPCLRSLQVRKKEEKRHLENIRKRLMKVIFKQKDNIFTLRELNLSANQQENKEEKLSEATIQRMMQELVYDFNADIITTDQGEVAYKFERIKLEFEEAQMLRKDQDSGLGAVVFESD